MIGSLFERNDLAWVWKREVREIMIWVYELDESY